MRADLAVRSSFLEERSIKSCEFAASNISEECSLKAQKIISRSSGTQPHITERLKNLISSLDAKPVESASEWINDFDEILEDFGNLNDGEELKSLENSVTDQVFGLAFLPFLYAFKFRVARFLEDAQLFYAPSILDDFVRTLSDDILKIAGMTLYCLYKDTNPKEELSPELYIQWSKELAYNGWPVVIDSYPLLGRFIISRMHLCLDAFLEIIERFETDISKLQTHSLIEKTDVVLEHVEPSLSDYHHSGRRVCRLTFSSGGTLIYKPKPLSNDLWFQERFTKKIGRNPSPFGAIKTLDCGQYGWAEDINAKVQRIARPCKQVKLAQTAALAYLLSSTDLHPENVIVDNEVYIVDFETILNSVPFVEELDDEHIWRFFSVASSDIFKTQFSLAPRKKATGNDVEDHIELIHPFHFFRRCDVEGVELKVIGQRNKNPEKPQEENTQKPCIDNVLEIIGAFESSVSEYKHAFTRQKLWESVPEKMSCRFVPRPTASYARLFQRLFHPFFLKDAALFSLELAELYFTLDHETPNVASRKAQIIDEEIRQIQNGDVPYFWYSTRGHALYSAQGVIVSDFLAKDVCSLLRDKIANITDGDISEQSKLLKTSLHLAGIHLKPVSKEGCTNLDHSFLSGAIANLCYRWSDEIISSANVPETAEARWVSCSGDVSADLVYPIAGEDSYYAGYWGILQFLAATEYILTRNDSNYDLKELSSFLEREAHHWKLKGVKTDVLGGLGLSGTAGKMEAWISLCDIAPDKWGFLYRDIKHTIRCLHDALKKSQNGRLPYEKSTFDYMQGVCGVLIPLLKAQKNFTWDDDDNQRVVDLIETIASMFMQGFPDYIAGNVVSPFKNAPVVGFAHGNASVITVIVSLVSYYKGVGNKEACERWINILEKILAYDEKYEITKCCEHTWLDNRYDQSNNVSMNGSWCHGLAGLGVSRLALLNIPEFQSRASTDLRKIINALKEPSGLQGIDMFCCGEAGCVAFLHEAAQQTQDAELLVYAKKRAAMLLNKINKNQSFNGLAPSSTPELFPSLFQGAGGIGYTFLTLMDDQLPSLLK